MNEPNFFIIGAPKCGTTSIFNALGNHPGIFPAAQKEPHYYSTDVYRYSRINRDDYLSLFGHGDSTAAQWRMEGSTRYLYSREAIVNIQDDQPSAKFLALVRNPVDMLHSLHNHLYFLGIEYEADFEKAWKHSFSRDRNELIAGGCKDPDSLIYPRIGCLGEQVARLNHAVPPSNRLVILYDDLVRYPQDTVSRILDFLGLEKDDGISLSKENRSMTRKSRTLFLTTVLLARIKRAMGFQRGLGVLNYINRMNRESGERKALEYEIRYELLSYFDGDIRLLEREIGRDLSDWRVGSGAEHPQSEYIAN